MFLIQKTYPSRGFGNQKKNQIKIPKKGYLNMKRQKKAISNMRRPKKPQIEPQKSEIMKTIYFQMKGIKKATYLFLPTYVRPMFTYCLLAISVILARFFFISCYELFYLLKSSQIVHFIATYSINVKTDRPTPQVCPASDRLYVRHNCAS